MKIEGSKLSPLDFVAACFYLSSKFAAIYSTTKNPEVDFTSCGVRERECGTIACHGGWGAVIFNVRDEHGNYKTYTPGAVAIGQHLGFSGKYELERWARTNPYYWGNNQGAEMFSAVGANAFINKDKPFNGVDLLTIANRWMGVGERVLEDYKKYLASNTK